jgi:hypothetical protein
VSPHRTPRRPTRCGVPIVPVLTRSALAGDDYRCLNCGSPVRPAGLRGTTERDGRDTGWKHTRGEAYRGNRASPPDRPERVSRALGAAIASRYRESGGT